MSDRSAGEIRVMIADDHPLLRSGIAAVLARSPQVTVVAEAEDGDAAVALFQQHRPDITLMDLQMPGLGGIEAIAAIRAIDPQARIIILTTFSGDAQIYRGLKAGASGYLLKNMARAELLDYLVSVHEGDSRLPLEVTRSLPNVLTMEPLTPRETDVLKLVATGHSNQRAASQLGLKEDTIKAYMKSILAKLRARDRTHAVTIALKRGFWEA
ncbi:response regulator transcription factor [Duganella sp. sic0402]|uniref:response regulator transcription factor n=1 Tax=Duganella sp. sic0402 TaxID=2854786 RepID=UPI001E6259FA|nr:response regulator transcription factor [Duganella sp. sic0402]